MKLNWNFLGMGRGCKTKNYFFFFLGGGGGVWIFSGTTHLKETGGRGGEDYSRVGGGIQNLIYTTTNLST